MALTAFSALRRLRRRNRRSPVAEAWLEDFSPDSYRPMLRLAEPSDIGFLTACRGLDEAKRYRRMQRRMLRGYLRSLTHDFRRLHTFAADNRQSISLLLIQEKMHCALSIWNARVRLLLNEIVPCEVNLRPLLEHVHELTDVVRETTPRRYLPGP